MSKDVTKFMMPVPENLKAKRARMVDSDLYNICERIREVDPNLFLVYHEDHKEPWVVMEHCADNTDRLVSRYEDLGAHILDDVRYMLHVPFEKRLAETEKRIELENAKFDGLSEEAMENFLYVFDKAARRSNLYNPIWGKNYRNIHKKGGGMN